MIGIYKITSPSNKVYIGKSIDIEKRFNQYKTLHCKFQRRLYNSLKKYGAENHKFEVIKICRKENILLIEAFYQKRFDASGVNGLNCFVEDKENRKRHLSETTKNAIKNRVRAKPILSAETLKRKSELVSGKNNPNYGKTGDKNPFYGRKHNEETKRKISEKNSGVNNYFYGKKRPELSIKLSGENHYMYGKKNVILSEYNKKNKIGNKNFLGKKHSEETKKIISLKKSGENHFYYGKKRPEHSLKMIGKKYDGKVVLDLNSGVFYLSLKDLCDLYGYKYVTMYARLSGRLKNETNFIFV